MTVVRECDSPKEIYQLVGRCEVIGKSGGVKGVRKRFQLMERYDGRGEDVRVCGKV